MDEFEQGTFKAMANPVEFCSVLCIKRLGVSSEHLNYKKHQVVWALCRFHVHYHVRRVLKDYRLLCHMEVVLRLQTILTPMNSYLRFVRIIEFLMIL